MGMRNHSRCVTLLGAIFAISCLSDQAQAGQEAPSSEPAPTSDQSDQFGLADGPDAPAHQCFPLTTGGGLCACDGISDCIKMAFSGDCDTGFQCEGEHCICYYGPVALGSVHTDEEQARWPR